MSNNYRTRDQYSMGFKLAPRCRHRRDLIAEQRDREARAQCSLAKHGEVGDGEA